MAKDDIGGVWRTVGGRRIFIKDGEDLETAMKKSGKFGKEKKKELTDEELKKEQFEIIKESNPMQDDYHVGIRSVSDIKTFAETIDDDESFVWGDFSRDDAKEALKKGEVTIYSSKPIEQGSFVSTSKNQAEDYAGGGKIYSKTIPLDDVAWINGDEGQYAKVKK